MFLAYHEGSPARLTAAHHFQQPICSALRIRGQGKLCYFSRNLRKCGLRMDSKDMQWHAGHAGQGNSFRTAAFNGQIISEWGIFLCQVRLPEGNDCDQDDETVQFVTDPESSCYRYWWQSLAQMPWRQPPLSQRGDDQTLGARLISDKPQRPAPPLQSTLHMCREAKRQLDDVLNAVPKNGILSGNQTWKAVKSPKLNGWFFITEFKLPESKIKIRSISGQHQSYVTWPKCQKVDKSQSASQPLKSTYNWDQQQLIPGRALHYKTAHIYTIMW